AHRAFECESKVRRASNLPRENHGSRCRDGGNGMPKFWAFLLGWVGIYLRPGSHIRQKTMKVRFTRPTVRGLYEEAAHLLYFQKGLPKEGALLLFDIARNIDRVIWVLAPSTPADCEASARRFCPDTLDKFWKMMWKVYPDVYPQDFTSSHLRLAI